MNNTNQKTGEGTALIEVLAPREMLLNAANAFIHAKPNQRGAAAMTLDRLASSQGLDRCEVLAMLREEQQRVIFQQAIQAADPISTVLIKLRKV